jgi:hypothetical protein
VGRRAIVASAEILGLTSRASTSELSTDSLVEDKEVAPLSLVLG